MGKKYTFTILLILILLGGNAYAQGQLTELNSGWVCKRDADLNGGNKENATGTVISQPSYNTRGWIRATVPGTVITTLLDNKMVPDPWYGMNNTLIKDVYDTGRAYYTYWFIKDFTAARIADEVKLLELRGVNYKYSAYLNGHKIANAREGMLLRNTYDITPYLAVDGKNRLAVLVAPPDPVGKPNGGQGGDGHIALNATTQYTAGWDWIQPMHDRNTGIWDKVILKTVKKVEIRNPHVVTLVPGTRTVNGSQQAAKIRSSAELINHSKQPVEGVLIMQIGDVAVKSKVVLQPDSLYTIQLQDAEMNNPRLWWPAGYGPQNMYKVTYGFTETGGDTPCDVTSFNTGIRQIDATWNQNTKSMQLHVNGQKIFVKGGNWIISDAMLRFSKQRYDDEIRMHRDMNLNMIRIWGGAITERPDFYEACDKYGMLVFQDFWFSGDCNGRWPDPYKADDQAVRRTYPANHKLTLDIMADQIKLVRNYPSLAIWCGGNEITPPEDILTPLKERLIPGLDGTRPFLEFSNSSAMSYSVKGNGDGPYTVQDPDSFWMTRTYPFNSEVGSVGVGDYASLKKFIPAKNLANFPVGKKVDSVWDYHKYIGYDSTVYAYGDVKDTRDFAFKAQLVNYDQYRALMEGFSAHMWDWYTGSIIWKTQNPWTALRGQMYDYYLDVNACLYGLRKGSEPVHVMYNQVDSAANSYIVNNSFSPLQGLTLKATAYDAAGKSYVLLTRTGLNVAAASVLKLDMAVHAALQNMAGKALFLHLQLEQNGKLLSDNTYWLRDKNKQYTALQALPKTRLQYAVTKTDQKTIQIILSNAPGNAVAFFNRVAVINKKSGKRILPAFYDDNYVTVLPGERKKMTITLSREAFTKNMALEIYGWNVPESIVKIP